MLTDAQAKAAKPGDKATKLADSHGLYLLVTPAGTKSWRWKYRFDGKEKLLVLGRYPDVGIREARALRDAADKARRAGLDPSRPRHEGEDFETVARRWHGKQRKLWREKHSTNVLSTLEKDVFPAIGCTSIEKVKASAVLSLLRKVEERGAGDQAHRLRQRIDAIFAMAIGEGIVETNPGAMVGKALAPVVIGRYPALRSLEDARRLIEASEAAPGSAITKLASRFLAVTAARSEAVRYGEWPELEALGTDKAQWRIPGAHMKGQRAQRSDPGFEFVIPLPPQVVDIIEAVRPLSGNAKLMFPGVRDPRRPMSDSTISTIYRRLPEFAGRHVPHGWRSTFSTVMNEWAQEHGRPGDREVIDLMLAHVRGGVEGIYNRSAHMGRRRELAAIWADMLLTGLQPAEALLEGRRC